MGEEDLGSSRCLRVPVDVKVAQRGLGSAGGWLFCLEWTFDRGAEPGADMLSVADTSAEASDLLNTTVRFLNLVAPCGGGGRWYGW
jgi:hypothetical protein